MTQNEPFWFTETVMFIGIKPTKPVSKLAHSRLLMGVIRLRDL
jgi:hypothetical protein